jgi:hypothetical protein
MIGKQQHKSKENAQSFIHFSNPPIHPFIQTPSIDINFNSLNPFIHPFPSFISSTYSSTSSISVIHSYLKEDLLEVTKRRGSSRSSSKMRIHFPTKKICFLRTQTHLLCFVAMDPLPLSLITSEHVLVAKLIATFVFLLCHPSLPPSLTQSLTHNRVICLSKLIATRVFLLLHYSRITSDHFACCKVGCKVATKLHLFFPSVALIHHIRAELLVVKLQP